MAQPRYEQSGNLNVEKCPDCQKATLQRYPNGDKVCSNCGYAEYVKQ